VYLDVAVEKEKVLGDLQDANHLRKQIDQRKNDRSVFLLYVKDHEDISESHRHQDEVVKSRKELD